MKQEPGHPALTYPGVPGLFVHGASAEAPAQAFVCLLQNLHIIIAEKSISGFLSEVGKSVSRRERRRCLFLYFQSRSP